MKLVYSTSNALLVNHVRNLLEAAGIAVTMKNEFLGGGAGELPPTEAWPELWVDEADYPRAQQVVEQMDRETEVASWRCHNCGELIEGQFDACWHCGASRPDQ